MSELKELLLPALRQYQHNDCSGLVFGYDKKEVESIVGELLAKLLIAKDQLENPRCLQELVCVEQMKEMTMLEIHRANQNLHEQLAKANERVDGLEKALANCADALYESNINHKKAIDKIQAECIDVLFDFAAKRDDSGFAIALYEQPYEIQDAIRIFKQLSKDQSNG